MPVNILASDTLKNDDYVILLDHSGSMLEKVPGDDAKGYERDPLRALKSSQALRAIAGVVESTIREGAILPSSGSLISPSQLKVNRSAIHMRGN